MGSSDFLPSSSEEGFQPTATGGAGTGGAGTGGAGTGGAGTGGAGTGGAGTGGAGTGGAAANTPANTNSCTSTQRAILSSDTAFFAWHNQKHDMLNTYIQKRAHSPRDITDIELVSTDIDSINYCLSKSIQSTSSSANQIFLMQEQVISLQEQIEQEAEHTRIAKDRVAYSQDPVKYSSYYSSWFPATRPLYYVTILVLLSVSLFVGMFGLLFILSLVGVDFSFFKNNAYDSRLQYGLSYMAQLSTPFWIAAACAVGLLIYVLVRK